MGLFSKIKKIAKPLISTVATTVGGPIVGSLVNTGLNVLDNELSKKSSSKAQDDLQARARQDAAYTRAMYLQDAESFFHRDNQLYAAKVQDERNFIVGQKLDDRRYLEAQRDKEYTDLRRRAKESGFNPLTLLGSSQVGGGGTFGGIGPVSGGGGSGPGVFGSNVNYGINGNAPLSSLSSVIGAVRDAAHYVSPEAELARKRETLETELLAVELEKARSGVTLGRAAPAYSPPPISKPSRVAGGSLVRPDLSSARSARGVSPTPEVPWYAVPGTTARRKPVEFSTGTFEVENTVTGGSVTIPGEDGDADDIGQIFTKFVFGAPQVAWNWGSKAAEWAHNEIVKPRISYDRNTRRRRN